MTSSSFCAGVVVGGAGGGREVGDNVAKDGRGCVIVGYVDMQYS